MRWITWLVGVGLCAGCGSSPPPPVAQAAAPAPVPIATLAPEPPLSQAQRLFEAGKYADAAALAGQLPGREADELAAVALLACGRELQAMAAYAELARRYPDNADYVRVHRALHNGWMAKRADNYLARAGLALNAGKRHDAAQLAEEALNVLYEQQGARPDQARLQLARQLLSLAQPPVRVPVAPAPVQVRVLPALPRPTQQARSYPRAQPVYPRAAPSRSAWRAPRARPQPVEVVYRPAPWPQAAALQPSRPQPPAFQPRRPVLSAVAQRRQSESLLHHYGSSMQPFDGSFGGSPVVTHPGW